MMTEFSFLSELSLKISSYLFMSEQTQTQQNAFYPQNSVVKKEEGRKKLIFHSRGNGIK